MDKRFIYILTLIYSALTIAGILRHEIWLDEAHHWLLARDSANLRELFQVTRPDGHPILWNLLLFAITRFTKDLLAMQLLNVIISTATVFIFLRNAPLGLLWKAMFIFGYFMFFEYSLFSRNYMLALLFLFAALSYYDRRRFLMMSLMLALAINTHLLFLAPALAFFLTAVFNDRSLPANRAAIAILIAGIGILAVQMLTTQPSWLINGDSPGIQPRLANAFISLLKGIIAVPNFRNFHFWNTNLLVAISKPIAFVFGALIYILPLLLLKSKQAIFFFYIALAGILLFFMVTHRTATRFHGITFMILILAMWIDLKRPLLNRFRFSTVRFRTPIITLILTVHLFSGVAAFAADFQYPFDNGARAAAFAKSRFSGVPIISFTCDGTVLSAYSQERFWIGCRGEYASFCKWQQQCNPLATEVDARQAIDEFLRQNTRAIYISYLEPLPGTQDKDWKPISPTAEGRFLLRLHEDAIQSNELNVWEVRKKNTR